MCRLAPVAYPSHTSTGSPGSGCGPIRWKFLELRCRASKLCRARCPLLNRREYLQTDNGSRTLHIGTQNAPVRGA